MIILKKELEINEIIILYYNTIIFKSFYTFSIPLVYFITKEIFLDSIMNYFYELNASEIKREYTTFLINIMAPLVYEGIKSVYTFSLNAHKEFQERGKHDPNIKSPGILKIFQLSLKEIPTLNNNSIEMETNRIKSGCKCADWFDDLVRAVVKSYIVLLTLSHPQKRSEILKEKYHEKIEISDFIHKCYIESARSIYNNPELFWHEFPPLEIKRNQREACELIKQAINEAVRQTVPMKLVLKEYLDDDYMINETPGSVSDSRYANIKSLIDKEKYPTNSILDSDDDYEPPDEDNDDSDDNINSTDSGNSENIDDIEKIEDLMKSEPSSSSIKVSDNSSESPEENIPLERSIQDDLLDGPKIEETENPSQNAPKIEIEMNDEIQNLLNKNNNAINNDHLVTNPEKLNKKEMALLKEIENELKPQEPDRKSFFEQYMK